MFRLLLSVGAFLLVLAWIFSPGEETRGDVGTEPAKHLVVEARGAEMAGEPMVAAGEGKVVIQRSDDGHFYADAQVGAATIRFLVDTGATAVALTRADAQRIGMAPIRAEFVGKAETANGSVPVKPVMIERIRIGPLAAENVEGVVIDGDLTVSLLGQSWLRRVGSVTIKGDQLILN